MPVRPAGLCSPLAPNGFSPTRYVHVADGPRSPSRSQASTPSGVTSMPLEVSNDLVLDPVLERLEALPRLAMELGEREAAGEGQEHAVLAHLPQLREVVAPAAVDREEE